MMIGTYNWFKISKIPDLPVSFIDKYFLQIYSYRNLQKCGNLPQFIINKYGNYLNWNILLMNQNVNQSLLNKYWNKINYKICAMTQKMSLSFMKSHYKDLPLKNLQQNTEITKESILDFLNYLDEVECEETV